ncbi:MAG: hypothetical protein LAO04_20455 [Acidobacteriia bacterium]|nr:hypothetical protein [Terriglobia bacterium]
MVCSLVAAQTPSAPSPPAARAIGVVTQIQPGNLTLRTDAGPEVQVQLPEGVTVLRVPPGAKDLKTAAKITVGEISPSDRVLVRGQFSEDQKSLQATSVVVMTRSDLASAHEAEVRDWQRRGMGGVVKALDPQKKEITIAVPNTPPTPGNPTRPVIVTLAPNPVLLRYAPDSVKFSDARPSTFEALKVGDQVRALGAKSEDGSHFTAEKLVSGTFRNIGATVISVDAPGGTVTVKDLTSGEALVVHTTADSKLHQLPPFMAEMIARFNSGGQTTETAAGEPPRGAGPGGNGGPGGAGGAGGPGGMQRGGPHDFQQMLERMPTLTLSELKPGQTLIVVSTEGAKPSEVTAIAILTGVEPILAARPKGSSEMNLGPWNMSMGGGEGAQ